MTKEQLAKLEVKITKDISRTQRSIAEYKELTKPIAPENAIGRVSRMDAINNKSVMEAALRQAEQKLDGLKTVIDQLQDDDFGLCFKCNEPIPIGRIMAMPYNVHCVKCAR